MVNVRQHDSAGPIIDEAAEVQFARAWRTYAKLVDNDYVFHREVYAILHRILVEDFPGPFRFLDLACGDARGIVGALQGTTVAHYHGVDLSRPALDMASVAVEALHCPVELDQRDFVAAMADRPEPADLVWIGLSLHHLQPADKLVIMREARGVLGGKGELVLYEPTCREGESREGYLERFAATNSPAVVRAQCRGVGLHPGSRDPLRFPGDPVRLAGARPGGRIRAGRAGVRGADRSLSDVSLRRLARLRVEEVRSGVRSSALDLEQAALGDRSARCREPAELAAGGDDPVAGHDQREGVAAKCGADLTRGTGLTDLGRELAIGPHAPGRIVRACR